MVIISIDSIKYSNTFPFLGFYSYIFIVSNKLEKEFLKE